MDELLNQLLETSIAIFVFEFLMAIAFLLACLNIHKAAKRSLSKPLKKISVGFLALFLSKALPILFSILAFLIFEDSSENYAALFTTFPQILLVLIGCGFIISGSKKYKNEQTI